jgi:hypothetical protein
VRSAPSGTPSIPSQAPSPSPSPQATGTGLQLRATDFILEPGPETAGFTVEKSDKSDYTEFPEQEFADCLGVPVELVRDRSMQTAIGPRISDKLTGFSLASMAAIVSEDVLASDREVILRPEYPGCAAELARDMFIKRLIADRGEGTGVSIRIAQSGAVPAPAGATARWNLVMSVSDPTGVLFETYYDAIFVFEGRVEATIYAYGVEPIDEQVVSAATAQVVEKVKHQ